MNKSILICFLLLLFACKAFAGGFPSLKENIMVSALVCDDFSNEVIGNAAVELYDEQNNVIGKCKTFEKPGKTGIHPINFVSFIARKYKSFTLRIMAEGYEEYSQKITVDIGKREAYFVIPTIKLKRIHKMKEVQLDGVTVTATKVKMVMHGDTIVYNADAFQLSNGSMLDELIRRLPGVQLKGNQIMVNGRFVSSLLVNGSDFFKGNPAVALQNLPAYTVNKLKVYEKDDDMAYITGEKKEKKQKPLVMDVALKRQYMQGALANFDLGYGTHDRWMARLFALRYTKNSRIGIFSNMNNINDTRAPGTNGDWNPSQQQDGLVTQRSVGIDYLLGNASKEFELSGNTIYSHDNINKEQIRSGENFLDGGNTFSRSRDISRERKTYVWSTNKITMTLPRIAVQIQPNFIYFKNNNNVTAQSATFSVAPNDSYRGAALDSIFAAPVSKRLQDAMLNRLSDNGKYWQHYYDGNLSGQMTFNIPKSPDAILLRTENHINVGRPYGASIYDLAYGNGERDFRNKYSERSSTDFNTQWTAMYFYSGDVNRKNNFNVRFDYNHIYSKDNRDLFRLDKYAEYGMGSHATVGYLPSTRDSLLRARDADNSYHSSIYKDRYEMSGVTPKLKLPVWGLHTYLEPGIVFRHEQIDYRRGSFSKKHTRNVLSWEPKLYIGKDNCSLEYKVTKMLPELTDILDFTTTDNPLNIWRGNPNLKNTDIHRIDFSRGIYKYDEYWYCTRRILINAYWQVMRNAIGQYVEYNRQTGAVRATPMNINGNWNAGASFEFMGTVDKKKRLMLNTKTEVGYNNSVDYVAVDGQSADSPRSSVRSAKADETLTLDYSLGKYAFGAKLRCAYLHAESPRSDFQTINTADVDYGLNATVELPLKLKLSTDITMYSRYGYSDPSMNTNNLVWNARLERTFGKFTVMADGFDLLGKLSNVRKVINAQGRTETWYNTVPRYAMLHVMYKMHFKPKR